MRRLPILMAGLAGLFSLAQGQDMTLEYLYRYNCQTGPDHLMNARALSGDRAIVGSNQGLALIDLAALPAAGTSTYLSRLTGVNARDLYLSDDEQFVFVNAHRSGTNDYAGFDVIRITGSSMQKVASVHEAGVCMEKMCLDGDYLYVAAHSYGLRIFDVSTPSSPSLHGTLPDGFVDAFDVDVIGDTAYVADGAGGLKIVDVTDRTAPAILAGETLATAVGTYEEVSIRDGRVYVAAGGAGLAVYEAGLLTTRTLHDVPGCAESLCWVGDQLVVGAFGVVTAFAIGSGTQVTPVASENAHRRGSGARLRLTEGVGAADGNRLMVSGWNYLDIYELKTAAAGTAPDINCDTQRIRFAPTGGVREVTVSNNGQGLLSISSVSVPNANFSAGYAGGDLQPGESVSFDITYTGSAAGSGSGVVLLNSNDPDESPLPIQVFGNTTYLDPGEPAVDFTLPTMERDPTTGQVVQGSSFTLSQHSGKVIYMMVFASW